VLSVGKGFRWREEVNRVTYEPETVTVAEMEERLKQIGTYVRTVAPSAEQGAARR
jgi:hypothetical protein